MQIIYIDSTIKPLDISTKINNQITAPELRVIDEAGANLGVLSLAEAKKLAEEKGVDLILLVATVTPPIAKIMSYDKFRYIKEKEMKKKRQAEKAPEMKQIQISPREATNDLMMKIGRMKKFIEGGHRVEVNLKMRGREKAMKDWSKMKMEEFKKMINFPHKLSQNTTFDGRQFSIRIDPIA